MAFLARFYPTAAAHATTATAEGKTSEPSLSSRDTRNQTALPGKDWKEGPSQKRGELLASPSAQEGAGPVGSDASEWVVSEKKNQRVDFPGLSDERLRRGTDLLACAPLTCVMHKVTD